MGGDANMDDMPELEVDGGRSLRSDPVGITYPECITSPLIPNPTKSYIPPPYILIMCSTVLFVLCLSVIRIGARCEEENKTPFYAAKKKKKKKKNPFFSAKKKKKKKKK